MPTTNNAPALPTAPAHGKQDLKALEHAIATSKGLAWLVIAGLPTLGLVATLCLELPLFACLMAGSFMLGTALVCHRAITTFTGKVLCLLIAARLVLVLVVASLLCMTTGTVWTGLVSMIVLWLFADRILGRRALYDLWKLMH